MKKGFLLIGKIVAAHGVKGNCKIHSYAESLTVFQPGSEILIATPSGRENVYQINWAKAHAKVDLLSLKGVETRSHAQALIGSELFIEKVHLPELDDGSYYWYDLIGMDVYTIDDTYLGCLERIIQTGSNDVYVVKNDADEIWIPALESVVHTIDLKKKRMQVVLPEGLV
ncbi:MAG: 16S rRNA processing protein RimM [Desulfobacterales bacterium]|nr:MAG: 16S rRNA processing protein RimM [Desulfobacterales bacterium]